MNVTRNLKGGGLFPLGEINCTRDFHSIRGFFFAKHSSDPSQSWCVKCGVPRRYILKPDIRNDWQDQNPKTPREKFPTKRVVASEDVRLSIAKALL